MSALKACLLTLTAFLLVALLASRFGVLAPSTVHMTDWPWHASETEIYLSRSVADVGWAVERAAVYPPLAYHASAVLSRVSGAEPPRVLSWLSLALLAAAAGALALRIVGAGALGGRPLAFAAGALLLLAAMGAGLRGLVQHNFYYTQLFSIALAFGATIAIERFERKPWVVAVLTALVGGALLPLIHLSVAPWFVATELIFLALACRKPGLAVGTGVACLALAAINPSVGAMVGIAGIDGGLFMSSWVRPGLVFTIMAVLAGIAAGALLATRSREKVLAHRGLIAICLVLLAEGAAWVFLHAGSWYGIKKNVYVLGAELVVSWAVLRAGTGVAWAPARAWLLLFAAQLPWAFLPVDQAPLLARRQELLVSAPDSSGVRRYPEFPELSPAQNLYLAIGILKYPLDEETQAWRDRKQ